MAAALPLAAGLDWIEGILPLLFLLFWIVSQVRNLFAGAGRAKPAEPVVVRLPRRPQAADEEGDLTRQIEEFLREASRQRPAAAPAGRPAGRDDRPRVTEKKVRRDAVAPPAPPGARTSPPPVQGRRAGRPGPAPAAVEPQRPLGSLGGHATDVARHVKDAFAHEIEHLPSGLSRVDTAAASPLTVAGLDLASLIRDPATLRQLMIVREVLDRPVDRW